MLGKEQTVSFMAQNREPETDPMNRVNCSLTKEQRQHSGAKKVSSTKGAGTPGSPHAKQTGESRHRPYAFIQTNSKWTVDLNVTCRTTAVLEGEGASVTDFWFGSNFLDTTSEAQCVKEKVGKRDLIKTINFSSMKDAVQRMKRQTTDREKAQWTTQGLIHLQ